jgi:hypothetical protein
MTRHWLVLTLLTAIPLQAVGISPATREQILCNSTHIVVGEIVETDIKCQKSQRGESTECSMLLATKITKVVATAKSIRDYPEGVGVKDAGVEPGLTLDLRSWYPNGYQFVGSIGKPNPESISKELKGRSFILSISSGFGLWLGNIPLKKEAAANYSGVVERFNRPYYSELWDLQNLQWVTKAIAESAFCSKFELGSENR